MKNKQGFTLIELLIVVLIIAVLAAIALPAYQNQVRKARRSVARGDLVEIAQQMERNFTMMRDYTKKPDGTTFALPFTVSPRDPNQGGPFYNLTLVDDSKSYTVTATPTGPQTVDMCGTLTINNLGQKTFVGNTAQCAW